jgi:hypothetical protein
MVGGQVGACRCGQLRAALGRLESVVDIFQKNVLSLQKFVTASV